MKKRLIKIVRHLKHFLLKPFRKKQKYYSVTKHRWDKEFHKGHWDRLERLEELSRYSLIVGYFDFYVDNKFIEQKEILDLGCGQGILQQKISKIGYNSYTGVDISSEAISQASNLENDNTSFFQSDIKNYQPNSLFDFIIFNEILYYLENPLAVVKKYASYLHEKGFIIISQYNHTGRDIDYSWNVIDKTFPPNDEVKLIHNSGKSWTIKSYNKISSFKQNI